MTIEELKAKQKDDSELIKFIDEQDEKVNKNYLEENIKLIKENNKLKADNSLLFSQLINSKGATEEKTEAPFKDYTDEILKDLRNR